MKLAILALPLTLCLSLPALAAPAQLLDEKVQQTATAQVAAGVFPSLVIGVVRGDQRQIISFGSIADDRKQAPDADTVYEIGSVTKTFTALLLAEAIGRGEVTLDEPVQQLLPDYKIPKSGDKAITLADLATQSSGLPRLPDNLLPKNGENPYADYTTDNLKQFLAGYKLPRAPGTQYEYSNLGFGLLGQALAQHAGTTYAALLRNGITAPLGMDDTAISLTHRMAARFAQAHNEAGKPGSAWDFDALAGCGAIRSTVHDLLIYVQAEMHPPAGPLAKALANVVRPLHSTDSPERKIGLAWMTQSLRGRSIVWHNGQTGGYASFVGFTADGEIGVVVLTNVSREVTQIGLDALVPPAKTEAGPKEVSLEAKALAEYAGVYRLAPGIDLVVAASATGLSAQVTGQPAVPVFASAKDEFFYKVVDAQLSFKRDSAGKLNGVVLHQNGRNMEAPRVADAAPAPPPHAEIKVDPASLERYAGKYPLAPGFALQVTVENGQLFVQATAQPRFPVFPSAPDEFFYKVVDAQLTFHRAPDGSVKSVTLHQNGQNMEGTKE